MSNQPTQPETAQQSFDRVLSAPQPVVTPVPSHPGSDPWHDHRGPVQLPAGQVQPPINFGASSRPLTEPIQRRPNT